MHEHCLRHGVLHVRAGKKKQREVPLQTTHIYEHAAPALKEKAIARTAPFGVKPGRYRPPDTLLAFLESL